MKIREANLKIGDKFTVEFKVVRIPMNVDSFTEARALGAPPSSINAINPDTLISNIVRARSEIVVGMKVPSLLYTDRFWEVIAVCPSEQVAMVKSPKPSEFPEFGTMSFKTIHSRIGE